MGPLIAYCLNLQEKYSGIEGPYVAPGLNLLREKVSPSETHGLNSWWGLGVLSRLIV